MNKSTLIKKESLPNNFKLTFKSQENTHFFIVHEEQKELYNRLELNIPEKKGETTTIDLSILNQLEKALKK